MACPSNIFRRADGQNLQWDPKETTSQCDSYYQLTPSRPICVCHTWHITNILQLKKVFDTPLVQLEISRKFRLNPDGSYTYKATPLNEELCSNSKRQRPCKNLRPVEEYRTFLKAGQISSDPRDVTPFKIEWVPDILPRARTGELW